LGDQLKINLSGDMGSTDAANGLKLLLSLMRDQVLTSMAKATGKQPGQLPPDSFVVRSTQNVLQLAMSLNNDLLKAMISQ